MKKEIRSLILASILIFFSWDFLFSLKYSDLGEVKQFVKRVSKTHNLSRKKLINLFDKVVLQEKDVKKVVALADNPVEKKWFWNRYRDSFVNKQRIAMGKKFYRENAVFLEKAYKKYKVPPSIIVATLGMETIYGRNTGSYNVFQTLCAHSFRGHRRKKFFLRELEYLLVLNQKENLFDLQNLKGSYSGAIGPAQFMPRTLFFYAVDGNGDKKRDMLKDYQDVIMSVAHYYKESNWKKGAKVVERISTKKAEIAKKKKQKNIFFFEMPNKKKIYFRYYNNFRAIKLYNNSNYYAMALYMLSRGILLKNNEK